VRIVSGKLVPVLLEGLCFNANPWQNPYVDAIASAARIDQVTPFHLNLYNRCAPVFNIIYNITFSTCNDRSSLFTNDASENTQMRNVSRSKFGNCIDSQGE
jgi:hypothetical protein